ncbi:MAG: hypothetical protein QXT63_00625 [Thermoplasmata archaeon]
MRVLHAILIVFALIAVSYVSAMNSFDHNEEYMCGNGACHIYESAAIITMETSNPSPIINERNVTVRVVVCNSEQQISFNISVQLLSRLQLVNSHPNYDGWIITKDANNNPNPSNYCQQAWNGSFAIFEWVLTAPPSPGVYKIYANYLGGHDKAYYKTNTTGITFNVYERGIIIDAELQNQTIEEESTASFPINIVPIGGFSGTVNISVEHSIPNAILEYPQTCTEGRIYLNVTLGSGHFGNYTLSLYATYTPGDCEQVCKRLILFLNVTSKGTFYVNVDQASKKGYAGENASFVFVVQPIDNFDETVSVSVFCNYTLSPSLSDTQINLPAILYLNLSPIPDICTGNYSIFLQFSGGNQNLTKTLTYEILDFHIESPSNITLTINSSISIPLILSPSSNDPDALFERPIEFFIDGLAENVSAEFSNNHTYLSQSPFTIFLNLSANSNAKPGNFVLHIISKGGNRTHEINIFIFLVEKDDFIIRIPFDYAKLTKMNAISFSIYLEKIGDFNSSIILSAITEPNDLEVTFSKYTLYAGNFSDITINAPEYASPSLHILRVIANSSGIVREVCIQIDVTDFKIEAEHYSISTFGGNLSVNISVIPLNGFSGNLSFAYISSINCMIEFFDLNATLHIHTDELLPGEYNVTVQAWNGSLTRTLTIHITKQIDDNFQIEIAPKYKKISQYSNAVFLVGLICNQTFNDSLTLSLVGLPPGFQFSISPSKLTEKTRTASITLSPQGLVGCFNFSIIAQGRKTFSTNATLEVSKYIPFTVHYENNLTLFSGSWQSINLTIEFLDDCNDKIYIIPNMILETISDGLEGFEGLECKSNPSTISPLEPGKYTNVSLLVRTPADFAGNSILKVNLSSQKYTCGIDIKIEFVIDPSNLGFVIDGKRNLTFAKEIKFILELKNTGKIQDTYILNASSLGLGKSIYINHTTIFLQNGKSAKFYIKSTEKEDKILLKVTSKTNESISQVILLSGLVLEETKFTEHIFVLFSILCAISIALFAFYKLKIHKGKSENRKKE